MHRRKTGMFSTYNDLLRSKIYYELEVIPMFLATNNLFVDVVEHGHNNYRAWIREPFLLKCPERKIIATYYNNLRGLK